MPAGQISAVNRSLLCFRSPYCWLAIAILLLNDHLFKTLHPSWLTGKLSDFAGLFFFPFLVVFALGLFMDRVGTSPRTIAKTSFVFVGLWFFLIKSSLLVNNITEIIVGSLLGGQIEIVMDPTDLIALFMLWPAWRLWKRPVLQNQRATPIERSPQVLIALGLSAIAVMATSPVTVDRIEHVAVIDQTIYAVAPIYNGSIAAFNDDSGHWEAIFDNQIDRLGSSSGIPGAVKELLEEKPNFPQSACTLADEGVCYRVVGTNIVEMTLDGGKTWQMAWDYPLHRQPFMDRLKPVFVDAGPYDVAIQNHSDGTYKVIVALGNEGVLVGDGNGEWERQAILEARPTPFKAAKISDVFEALTLEIFIWFGFTMVTLAFISIICWLKARAKIVPVTLTTLTVSTIIFIPGLLWLGAQVLILFLGIGFLVLLALLLANDLTVLRPSQMRGVATMTIFWFLAGGTVFLGFAPLVLWTWNIVPYYWLAMAAAILMTGLILLTIAYQTQKLLQTME